MNRKYQKITAFFAVFLTTVTVFSQEIQFNKNLVALVKSFMPEAEKIISIFPPDDPVIYEMLSRPTDDNKFFLPVHWARWTRQATFNDMEFIQDSALIQLSSLIKSYCFSYFRRSLLNEYGEKVPQNLLGAAEAVSERISNECVENISRAATVYYSGQLSNGSYVFGGCLVLAMDKKTIVDIIKNEDVSKFNADDTATDLMKEIDRIRGILEKNPFLTDQNDRGSDFLSNN